MHADADIVTMLFGLSCLALFFLPVVISLLRGTGNAIAVFLVCLFFGWTFIGWIIALIVAFGRRPTTVVHVHYNTPAPQSGNSH